MSPPGLFNPVFLAALQTSATAAWHLPAPWQLPEASQSAWAALVLEQHRANFDLWHREDEARDPQASDMAIAAIKRSIDRLNQHRNDLVERIDTALLAAVQQPETAPLHSETPGLIIDRLSILDLKIFHTAEQLQRTEAGQAHLRWNRDRLSLLNSQREDLLQCLVELWAEVTSGKRRFKLYRQLKMYNDPALNPVLYGAPGATARKPSGATATARGIDRKARDPL